MLPPPSVTAPYTLEVIRDKQTGDIRAKLTITRENNSRLIRGNTGDNGNDYYLHDISSQTYTIGPDQSEVIIMHPDELGNMVVYRRIWWEPPQQAK